MNSLKILKEHYTDLVVKETDSNLLKIWLCKLETIKECIKVMELNNG